MKTKKQLSQNIKASIFFVALSYTLTIASLLIVKSLHLSLKTGNPLIEQGIVGVSMFFPALSAIIVQTLYLHKRIRDLGFTWGKVKDYIVVYFTILGIFIVNYLFTSLFIQKPDLTLQSFIDAMVPGAELPVKAPVMIFLFTIMTLFLSPLFNMIPSLGEEIGWRGFLLANLEKTGKVKASIISSIIWALWHTPMIIIIGFGYGGKIFPGVIIHFFLVSSLGIYIAYYWLKTRSTILAAFMHSVVNAHAYGVWAIIFVSKNPAIVGPVGIINGIIVTLLGIYILIKMHKKNDLTNALT